MQEVAIYDHQQMKPQYPDQEHLKCPRCDSDNTKFCYYNNYNLSQPRHYCKSCRRYWTKGGALRNIPVGGGSRKPTKRSAPSNQKRSSIPKTDPPELYPASILDVGGSFSSLMTSPLSGQLGNLLEDMSPGLQLGEEDPNSSSGANLIEKPEVVKLNQSGNDGESVDYLGIVGSGGDDDSSNCWGSGNGWPDLAIYTPGSTFQ